MGAYVRRRALGQRVRAEEEHRLGTVERRELNRIGSNLNQVARRLNSGSGGLKDLGFALGGSWRPGLVGLDWPRTRTLSSSARPLSRHFPETVTAGPADRPRLRSVRRACRRR